MQKRKGTHTVIVTGSLGYDYIMDFNGHFADRIMAENIHKISLAPLVDTLNKQFGGTAGNIAYSLHLLGENALIQSCGGNDFSEYRVFLNKKGMDTSYIREISDVVTGTYFVVTDTDDNQIGAFYKGALTHNVSLHLADIKGKIDFLVVAPNEPKAMQSYMKEAQKMGIPYMFDPAFQIGDFSKAELVEGISGAEILIANDYEMNLIEDKLEVSHEELLVMGPKVIITTLGAKGSIIENRNEAIHIKPAKPKKVLDPTGAGDAFRSGFLAGYLAERDLAVCGKMGSVSSVYTVEKYGTVTHDYTKEEFAARYKENFEESLSL